MNTPEFTVNGRARLWEVALEREFLEVYAFRCEVIVQLLHGFGVWREHLPPARIDVPKMELEAGGEPVLPLNLRVLRLTCFWIANMLCFEQQIIVREWLRIACEIVPVVFDELREFRKEAWSVVAGPHDSGIQPRMRTHIEAVERSEELLEHLVRFVDVVGLPIERERESV